jgi:hypothetical protein
VVEPAHRQGTLVLVGLLVTVLPFIAALLLAMMVIGSIVQLFLDR